MKSKKNIISLFAGVCFLFLNLMTTGFLFADPADAVKSLLTNIGGWEAEEAEGSSVNMPGMKMITATRSYLAGEAEFSASIIIGSSAMIQAQQQPTEMESSDASMATENIDGYYVVRAFNKSDKSGYVVVNVFSKTMEGVLFTINYTGISPEQALSISKSFNWSKIKEQTSSLVQ